MQRDKQIPSYPAAGKLPARAQIPGHSALCSRAPGGAQGAGDKRPAALSRCAVSFPSVPEKPRQNEAAAQALIGAPALTRAFRLIDLGVERLAVVLVDAFV